MNRTRIALAVLLAGLVVESAGAQQPYVRPQTSPYPKPTVSPYLNIASGLNPAIAYYGIVRPTQQFQGFEQTLIGPGGTLSTTRTTSTTGQALVTGTTPRFMSYSAYFNNVGGQRLGIIAPPPGYTSPVVNQAPPIGGR